MHRWIVVICLLATGFSEPMQLAAAQIDRDAQAAEEATARLHAERFLEVLRRRPSFGTALQRVSDFHLERGTLDELIRELSTHSNDTPDQLIAGMLEVHRGQGEEAVSLLEEVERQRPNDPVASQTLARAFQDAGNTDSAIAAFERAVERRPPKSDLRTIYQSLARLYQRAGFPDRALDVWKQLESAFPQDRLIQEDVAARLQESGQLEAALERWARLADTTATPEQRTQYHLNAADIHVRLGHDERALELLNAQLERIRSGSWLDSVIRKKIERVLLSTGGRLAVIDWYQDRVDRHPDDRGAIIRLAALLADAGRFDEAESLYLNAVRQQPSSVDLRVAFVELLAARNQIDRACAAGKKLAELPGAGTDEFELVGRLLLRNPKLSRADRETQASQMWQRICEDETDVSALGATARLHYRNGLIAQAEQLFSKAIVLDPDNSAWREELGRCLMEQGDTNGAVAVWNEIAAEERRSVRTLVMLSEILESAKQHTAALNAMRQACELEPSITDRIRYARLLQQTGNPDACYDQLNLAFQQAESVADRRIVLEAKVNTWQKDPGLLRRIVTMESTVDADNSDRLIELAWMCHTGQQYAKAVMQCERAIAVDETSVLAWESAAEIYLAAGLLERASDANRQLADLSPQARISALQQVVRLEQQLGRDSAAIDAAGLLVKETPGHVSSCRQFAELCFATGRDADGITCLRQCLRLNPKDYNLAVDVSQILAEQFQVKDAEAVLWQCFERTESPRARLHLIDGLIELTQQSGTVAQLIQRLQASSHLEPVDRISFVASVRISQDELTEARRQLKQGLQQYGRDERLLGKLVEVTELQQDFEAASEFQQQLADLSGRSEEQVKLADLRFRSGEMSESELAWIRDARSGDDTAAAIRSIDRFLDGGRIEAAELMSQRLAADRPTDWRVLYRLAMIQWRLDRIDDSVSTLQKIIDLDLPSDHAFAEDSGAATRNRQPIVNAVARRVSQILNSLNWLQLYTGNELWSEQLTAPPDYGAARCAAVGFRWLAGDAEMRKRQFAAFQQNDRPALRELTDWCGIVFAAQWESPDSSVGLNTLLGALERSADIDAKLLTVGLIGNGGVFRCPVVGTRRDVDQIQRLVTAAEAVATAYPEWLSDAGGWPAVYQAAKSNVQTGLVDSVLERLAASSKPATRMSAARLAITHRNLLIAEQIVTDLLSKASRDPNIDEGLGRLATQLFGVAEQAVAASHWELFRQATDLAIQLHAARYAEIEAGEPNGSPQYRLRHFSGIRSGESLMTPRQPAGIAGTSDRRRSSPFVVDRDGRVRFRGHADSEILIEFNEHLDQRLFSLLFLLGIRQSPDVSEARLVDHLRQMASDRSGTSWITASVTLGFYSIAMNDTEEGMRLLVPVVDSLPEEVDLKVVVVQYLTSRNAHRTALAILNELPPPSERDEILRQEQLALNLSVETADLDRARLAASRLFELSLEPEQVSAAAEQLTAIGLADVAERFQNRISGTPSTRTEQLRAIMHQYHDRGNLAAASRIARQFVLQPSVTLEGASAEESVKTRSDAIRLLAEAGHLEPLIRQLRRRVREADASFYQHHILVELLRAGGHEEEAIEVAKPLRESLVGDTKSALQLARQLERQGQLEAACTVCRYLLEADGALFHRDYYRFIRLFERTGQLDDLADLLIASSFDSSSSGHWGIQQLTERLLMQEASRERGLVLFAKAWNAWPRSRVPLLANVTDESIWALPEVYEHGLQKMLPTSDRTVGPWSGVVDSFHVRGRGMADGTLSRIFVVPQATDRLQELRQVMQKAVQQQPDWHAGRIYIAVATAMMGDTISSAEQLEGLLNETLEQVPLNVAWVTASQLHRIRATELNASVVRLLKHVSNAQRNGQVLLKAGGRWDESPDYLLVQYSALDGDSDTTRQLLESLVQRQSKQLTGSDPAKSETPQGTLVESLQSNLPEEANWFREASEAIRHDVSTTDKTGNSAVPDAESRQVIQMIEDALLR